MTKCANPYCDKILEEVYKNHTLSFIKERKFCSKKCIYYRPPSKDGYKICSR